MAYNGDTGVKGLYPIYADAYRELANDLGILPRELQSITWEAQRNLFSPTWKRNKNNVATINRLWQDYRDGTISPKTGLPLTADETRAQIHQAAGAPNIGQRIVEGWGKPVEDAE